MHETDLGTPQIHQQHITVEQKTEEVSRRTRIMSQIPIDYYLHRGWITMQQWEAGDKFHAAWYFGAEKSLYVTTRYDTMPRGTWESESAEKMKKRYVEAVSSIRGLPAQLVVYNVVCLGEWARSDVELHRLKLTNKKHYLEALDEKIGKNRRMKLLKQGLDDLARYFKIPAYPVHKEVMEPA